MIDLDALVFAAFADELEKVALTPVGGVLQNLARRSLSAGSMASLGAVGVGGVGAVAGGVQGGLEAQRKGESALSGAIHGAGRGAALGSSLGAAAGGIGGFAAGRRGADLAKVLARRRDAIGGISRFGQRQLHSVTGAVPEGFANDVRAIRSIGAGGRATERSLRDAQKHLRKAKLTSAPPSKVQKLEKRLELAQSAKMHAGKADAAGMTSIPGMARTLIQDPRKFVHGVGHATAQQWKETPGAAKALAYGMPAAYVVGEAAKKQEEGDRGRASRTLAALGDAAPFMLPMPILGSTVLSGGLRAAGGAVGSLRRKKPALPAEEPSGTAPAGSVPAPERIFSDRASGSGVEGWSS